jgi:hypothetical protein
MAKTYNLCLEIHHVFLLLQSFRSVSQPIFIGANNNHIYGTIISTNEDPGSPIESFAIIEIRGVSTKI